MNTSLALFRVGLLTAAVALAVLPPQASAQEMDHSKMNMPTAKPAPAKQAPVARKTVAKPASKPAMTAKPAPPVDHSRMDMPAAKPAPARKLPVARKAAAKPAPVQKPAPAMDHSRMQMPMPATETTPVDHAAMGHDMPMPAEPGQAAPMDHSTMGGTMDMPQSGTVPSMQGMDHSAIPGMTMAHTEPVTPIPVLTDADRAAAVPPSVGHAVHDNSIQSFVLVNRLEAWNADPGTGLLWEGQGWIGTDLDRLWLRSEGERVGGRLDSADLEVLYGRSVATWWDVVVGVRHVFKPGPSQDFAAVGVIGLAPQKFEIGATAYIGTSGQTALRFEAERELLLTNRLILQPLIEANLYGKDDPQRGIGSGLSTMEAGLRLRYEVAREFAPYIGIVRERAFGGTADARRAEGEAINDTRLVAGFRIWF